MPDLHEIQLAMNSLKVASDIVKGWEAIRSAADREARIRDLTGEIATAYKNLVSALHNETLMLKRNQELEAELVRLKNWEADKQRYEFKRIEPGTHAYVLKQEAVKSGEPMHMLCQGCYHEGKKGIFDRTTQLDMGHQVYECSACNKRRPFDYAALSELGLVE